MAAPLKDNIGGATVTELAAAFAAVEADFDADGFAAGLAHDLAALELKDRVGLIADRIHRSLTVPYPQAVDAVLAAAERVDGWSAWPLCSFVERHGVDWPEESLRAMPTLTGKWSCEFAIRPFLDQHLEHTRGHLRDWVDDPDEAVRRLASEGTRPLLPWAPRVRALIEDPEIGLELLDRLSRDPSAVVRRSVANHLNDIAKRDGELVVERLRDWTAQPEPVDPALVRHALRTLIKAGDASALELLGYTTSPLIDIARFDCSPGEISLGDDIELRATVRSTAAVEQRLVVDFVVHHVTATGGRSSKVFKWTDLALLRGETSALVKRRRIQTASTRRYTAGRHVVDLQIAGQLVASTSFELRDSSPR